MSTESTMPEQRQRRDEPESSVRMRRTIIIYQADRADHLVI